MEIDFTTNRVSRLIASKGRMAVVYIAIILGVLFFSLWHLGRLNGGYSPAEESFTATTMSIHQLIDNPLYAPIKVGQYGLRLANLTAPVMMRLISVVIGLVAISCFYLLVRHWHTRRMALIATALLGGSSWFLSIARTATPDILLVAVPLALVCVNYFSYRKERVAPKTVFMIKILTTIVALYVPYMIWFVLVIDALYFRQLRVVWRKLPNKEIVFGLFVLIVGVAPLGYSFVKDYHLLQQWAGIPTELMKPRMYLDQFLRTLASVGIRTVPSPGLRLGNTPLLDMMSTILMFVGFYYYWLRRHTRICTVLLSMGIATIALLTITPGSTTGPMALLLPFVYINIAAGATLLLQQWFTVFPRNNIARGIGVALLCILVGMGIFFHFQKYFVAWPQSPATKEAFSTITGY